MYPPKGMDPRRNMGGGPGGGSNSRQGNPSGGGPGGEGVANPPLDNPPGLYPPQPPVQQATQPPFQQPQQSSENPKGTDPDTDPEVTTAAGAGQSFLDNFKEKIWPEYKVAIIAGSIVVALLCLAGSGTCVGCLCRGAAKGDTYRSLFITSGGRRRAPGRGGRGYDSSTGRGDPPPPRGGRRGRKRGSTTEPSTSYP